MKETEINQMRLALFSYIRSLPLRRRMATGFACALLFSSVWMTGCVKRVSITVQAGNPLPNPAVVTGVSTAEYAGNIDRQCINHAGSYTLPITDAEGNLYELKLTVRDTVKPIVTPCHVYCPLGTVPDAADFIGEIEEADDYEAFFPEELPDMSVIGDYDIIFRVKDASGNTTKDLHSVVTIIMDTEAPVFVYVPELSATVGDAIAYRQNLVVTDDCCGNVEITVDSSQVNPNAVGDYPVYYTATDSCGNSSYAQTVIHIYGNSVSETDLYSRVDGLIASIIKPGMSAEEKCRAVYRYIHDNIAYVSDSDKSDWMRAAYQTLFVTGSGDCFDFFAAAKAFLIRLGIDYREIQRTPGLTTDTHYWLLVNIGTSDAPRWYHFDCTRLRDDYITDCLLTDKQVKAYCKVRANFYAYDSSKYPAGCTTIITKTPKLEAYY